MWQRWKDVPDYERYYRCSSFGKIKSLKRDVLKDNGIIFSVKERMLKEWVSPKGYFTVRLSKNGTAKTTLVHQIVAISFIRHTPQGYKIVINHKDGNKLKSYASNLEVVTSRYNSSVGFRKNNNKFTSKLIGVCWDKNSKKWASSIYSNHKQIHLGFFDTEIEASNTYQNKLLQLTN